MRVDLHGAPFVVRNLCERRRRDQVQKEDQGAIQAGEVAGIEAADADAEFGERHCRDFVGHDAAARLQSVAVGWFDCDAQQRRGGRVRGDPAERYGARQLEEVILYDNRRARLAGVIRTAGDGPDLSTL